MNKSSLLALVLIVAAPVSAQLPFGLRDAQGRHVVARGFVVTTSDGLGEVTYEADDYARMVRMGANYQVIRLELGQLSALPGARRDEKYLLRLDGLVALGRSAGMKTVFKMTVYGVKGFSWEAFWLNQHGELDRYVAAWQAIWQRYREEASVVGYDLINEPRKLAMAISYDDLTTRYLLPHYRKLIDESHRINAAKVCLCQGIFMNKGEGIEHNQYAEIKEPIGRPNLYFSPHLYQANAEHVASTLPRLIQEASRQQAPMFIGEWGFPTFDTTDASVAEQQKYARLYQETADAFDRLGVGTIKAWFTGTRVKQNFLGGGPSTWSIFSDAKGVGTVERKYITDVIARPYPQAIAGDIMSFRYDYASRVLEVKLRSDNRKGESRIFVGANRHYPDGFSVYCGDTLILGRNPLRPSGLEVLKSGPADDARDFIWDEARQQLVIQKWPVDGAELRLRIAPGVAWP